MISGDETVSLLADALKEAWWVPEETHDFEHLRHAALSVVAGGLTPTLRFLRLVSEGSFAEAEAVLGGFAGVDGAFSDMPGAGQLLIEARQEAVQRMRMSLDILRRRSERLDRPWADDLADLLIAITEEREAAGLDELANLTEEIADAEAARAASILAAGASLDTEHAEYLRDLVVEKQWDAAQHLVEHGSVEFAVRDRPRTPPLARLGLRAPALIRSFARGQNPGRPSDGWREVDEQLMNTVSRIDQTGPASALAEALRCTVTVDGGTTTLRALFDGVRAATVTVNAVHLEPAPRAGQLSISLEGTALTSELTLDRTLQVLLSPGDRSWQLLRAIVLDWPTDQILSITQLSAPVFDRIETVLDLALRSPQTQLAAAIAHRAGFNMELAEKLLPVIVPLAKRDGGLSSEAIDAAMLEPEVAASWREWLSDFATAHPQAHLLLTEAASTNTTLVDEDLLAVLADLAGVRQLNEAVADLREHGFATEASDGEMVLHVEPLRVLRGRQ